MGGGVGDYIPPQGDPNELAAFMREVREGVTDPKNPDFNDFRTGDEPADVVDGGMQMFVGDPRARQIIKDFGVEKVPVAENVVDALAEHDSLEMGVPHAAQPGVDEIIAAYEQEFGAS